MKIKKIIEYILLCLTLISCKAQDISILDLKNKDLIAFSFLEQNIKSIIPIYGEEIYNNKGVIILKRNWANYGKEYFEKEFMFTKNLDTMKISCICGQEHNLYFENMKFKKGYFKIELSESSNFKNAKAIFLDSKLNKTKVINSYNKQNKSQKDTFIDLPFEQLEFLVIDSKIIKKIKSKN